MNSPTVTALIIFMCTNYSRGDVEFRAPPNTIDFFPNIKDNLTELTWAHAVNDASFLAEVLKGGIMMIEADVVMGTLIDDPSETVQPIMGHPPSTTSDISLQQFLHTVNEANLHPAGTMKGVKLDFKSIEVYKKSWDILDIFYEKIQYPMWINADILPGPVNSEVVPVDADTFLWVSKHYSAAMLSVGWTTRYGGDLTDGCYSAEQVAAMAERLDENGVRQDVTFPVRAGLAANSIPQVRELLSRTAYLNSTLTVWSSVGDHVDISKLRMLILEVGLDRVYLDVPEEISDQLHL